MFIRINEIKVLDFSKELILCIMYPAFELVFRHAIEWKNIYGNASYKVKFPP